MNEIIPFHGKVGIQQRVLPSYRARFVDRLATFCEGGLSVFAGDPQRVESIHPGVPLEVAHHVMARNIHLLRGKVYLCFQRGLMEWIEDWDPDVLILEANPRYLTNRGAIEWMHKKNRAVIGWGLGVTHSGGLLAAMRRWLRMRYLSSFDKLIAYSSQGAEQYAEAGILPERIHVAINSATLPPTSLPQREPYKERAPRVLFVGRLQERKRVDLLLQACSRVEKKTECWIVGDGPEISRLEKLAQDIYPETKFLGSKHGPELEGLFDQADLFVLPGTGGLAVQEAMAHGLPVIVAEGDGTQRDLVSKENGWLVEPGNLNGLSQALQEALADPEGLLKKGIASYQVVLDRANIDAMTGVFTEVMNRVDRGKV